MVDARLESKWQKPPDANMMAHSSLHLWRNTRQICPSPLLWPSWTFFRELLREFEGLNQALNPEDGVSYGPDFNRDFAAPPSFGMSDVPDSASA